MASSTSNPLKINLPTREAEMLPGQAEQFAPISLVGGDGGRAFQFPQFKPNVPQQFNPLHKIEVFIGDSTNFLYPRAAKGIQGIRVTLRNGERKRFGSRTSRVVSFEIHLDDRIADLVLRKNQEGTHVAQINFTTRQGQEFLVTGREQLQDEWYRPDLGSGICMGIIGRSGMSLNKLGFLFLRKVETCILHNVAYPYLPQDWIHIEQEILQTELNQQPPETQIKIYQKYTEHHYFFLQEAIKHFFQADSAKLRLFLFKSADQVSQPRPRPATEPTTGSSPRDEPTKISSPRSRPVDTSSKGEGTRSPRSGPNKAGQGAGVGADQPGQGPSSPKSVPQSPRFGILEKLSSASFSKLGLADKVGQEYISPRPGPVDKATGQTVVLGDILGTIYNGDEGNFKFLKCKTKKTGGKVLGFFY
eukprot:TRINITY_DN11520_c0_g1_i2.p1 TRINITY_DN11520_c0_g1~~TRINITY_DN11520_c0_g1_i2.p1  ORF type:complete len:448 (+),score=38.18 TRINITY_DN11520_c0_g1_i2:94-1344(+)